MKLITKNNVSFIRILVAVVNGIEDSESGGAATFTTLQLRSSHKI